MRNLTYGIVDSSIDAQQCFRLRYESNVQDGKRSAFLDHKNRTVRDDIDEFASIHYVKDGEDVVGTIRSAWAKNSIPQLYRNWFSIESFPELDVSEVAFSSRLIIRQSHRRSHVLTLLLESMYKDARRRGVTVDFMHAAPNLIGMYERIGYRCFKPGMVETDVGWHVPMLLIGDAHEWLHRIRSPYSMWASEFQANNARSEWFNARFPEYCNGMSPALLGDVEYMHRLQHLCGGALTHELSSRQKALLQGAIFTAKAGDVVAKRIDGFSDIVVQLKGVSKVRSLANERVFSGVEVVSEFSTQGQSHYDTELICLSDAAFVSIRSAAWFA